MANREGLRRTNATPARVDGANVANVPDQTARGIRYGNRQQRMQDDDLEEAAEEEEGLQPAVVDNNEIVGDLAAAEEHYDDNAIPEELPDGAENVDAVAPAVFANPGGNYAGRVAGHVSIDGEIEDAMEEDILAALRRLMDDMRATVDIDVRHGPNTLPDGFIVIIRPTAIWSAAEMQDFLTQTAVVQGVNHTMLFFNGFFADFDYDALPQFSRGSIVELRMEIGRNSDSAGFEE